MNGTETRLGDCRTITEVTPKPTPEPSKLIIELSNLGEGSMRTIKRELKTLIEDYGYRKMISGCVQVRDNGGGGEREKEQLEANYKNAIIDYINAEHQKLPTLAHYSGEIAGLGCALRICGFEKKEIAKIYLETKERHREKVIKEGE